MSESRDPTIKLFGKTIKLAPEGKEAGDEEKAPSNKEPNHESEERNQEAPASTEEEKTDEQTIITNEEQIDLNSSSPEKNSEASNEPNEANTALQDKSPKKPDKILPCPRCNSSDTKFCYYNNYNVNQPRHFCKNCQRYWTDGGSMRNVPVGAGRRKSKSSAAIPLYRPITIPDCVYSNLPESINLQHLNTNGTVLSFGSDSPLCESMVSVLNIVDKTMKKCNWVGTHQAENGEEQSSVSTITASNSNDQGQRSENSNSNGFPPNFPPNVAYGTPWPYPQPFCSASFPIPFYPPLAYWSLPCLSPQLSTSPSSGSSSSNSRTLGKHSREGNGLRQSDLDKGDSPKPEKRLWIPKTLRIDDPEKAAKCSVWSTMGLFKSEKTDSMSKGGGLFQAFESNGSSKTHWSHSSPVLHTNPAALSRSMGFQESSLGASAHGVSGF